jgi:hypothetical protein
MEKKPSEYNEQLHPRLVLVVGSFSSVNKATAVVERLLEQDFAADRISLLHKKSGPGDDMLGLIYSNKVERIKIWSKHGIIWGALWGLLTSISAMFIFIGNAALNVVDAIVGVSVNVLASAALGGVIMAAAALLTEFTSAVHKNGIPEADINTIRRAVEQGDCIVILHCTEEQAEYYTIHLRHTGAEPVVVMPIMI